MIINYPTHEAVYMVAYSKYLTKLFYSDLANILIWFKCILLP